MNTRVDWQEAARIERTIAGELQAIDRLAERNQEKVLAAFHARRVADNHLFGSTGYGLGDRGREQLDGVFAHAFRVESALVRPQLVSGTHALAAAFFALLRPGDRLVYATGAPYDTLRPVIGLRTGGTGSLLDFGIAYAEVPLQGDGGIDEARLLRVLADRETERDKTVVAIQRSPGYAWRRALSVSEIGRAIAAIKRFDPACQVIVDNCYGEFTEEREPGEVDADLVVGSLIKNPGGGLAPTGAYVAGAAAAVAAVADRVTAPGLGAEMGSCESYRSFFQGFFMAPHVVAQALKGSVFAAAALQSVGICAAPAVGDPRGDIVLRIRLETPERLLRFCEAVQESSPIDAHVRPEPFAMPGYADPVLMAAGAFVQGSSIELSADGPMRAPYVAYLQGGLTYEHVKIAVMHALVKMTSV